MLNIMDTLIRLGAEDCSDIINCQGGQGTHQDPQMEFCKPLKFSLCMLVEMTIWGRPGQESKKRFTKLPFPSENLGCVVIICITVAHDGHKQS